VGKLKTAVKETAAKTLNSKGRTQKKEWISSETFALIEEKRNCTRDGDRYRELNREVQAHLRRDRTNCLTGICQEMEEQDKRNRSKDLFATVDWLTNKVCPTVKVIKDHNGQTLTENAEILERWKVYCETLYRDVTFHRLLELCLCYLIFVWPLSHSSLPNVNISLLMGCFASEA